MDAADDHDQNRDQARDQGRNRDRDHDPETVSLHGGSAASESLSSMLPDLADPVSTQFVGAATYNHSLGLVDYAGTTQPQLDFSATDPLGWNWDLMDGGSSDPAFSEGSHRTGLLPPPADGGPSGSASSRATTWGGSRPTTSASLPSVPDKHGGKRDGDGGSNSARGELARLMSLCGQTRRLEGRLHDRLGTLDEVMKLNKTCLAEIVEVLGLRKDTGRMCRCSCAVMVTCLDTMLVLFEDVVKNTGLDPQGGGEARMPSLHFGVFELDPEEQAGITRRILGKELQNYRKVVRRLASTFQGPSSDTFHKLMGQWCLSLTNRVDKLPISLSVE